MSYASCMRSLARRKYEVGWRTVLGTLIRQGYADGHVPAANVMLADLKRVHLGGRRKDFLLAYKLVKTHMRYDYECKWSGQGLPSMGAKPRPPWVQHEGEPFHHVSEEWLNRTQVFVQDGPVLYARMITLVSRPPKGVWPPVLTCANIEEAFTQRGDLNEEEEKKYAGQLYVTLEYAGAGHLKRGSVSHRKV